MKSFKRTISLLILLIIPFFAVSALSNGDKTETKEDVRTIEIKGSDRMKFDVTEITASPGEEIRIVLTTVSKIPKVAMAHNVVVMEKDTDLQNFVNKSAMARGNEYIAPELKDKVIAATGLAGGGETVEVTFTVPEETGDYTYLCSFPGHYAGGMKGILKVR